MSTKIYNAYLFNSDIFKLQEELNKIREHHFNLCVEDAKRILIKPKAGIDWTKRCLDFVKLLETSRKSTSASPIDFSAEAVIFPKANNKFLVQFFRLHHKLEIPKIFIEYHYQNQTDQPEGISDEEWEQRRKDWDEIYDKYISPSEAGFIYEIFGANQETNMFLKLTEQI
jgi:hypothetical protein